VTEGEREREIRKEGIKRNEKWKEGDKSEKSTCFIGVPRLVR
jgi:hypothetical protein